jgi:hypothetical protein
MFVNIGQWYLIFNNGFDGSELFFFKHVKCKVIF